MGWIQVLKYFRVAATAAALLAAGCNNHTISTRGQQEFLPQKVQQVKFDSLEKVAKQLVARVKDDPKARVAIREEFYRKHGGGRFHQYGFGNSEIAFLKWEERGLLNPLISTPPGSPWWREVNLDFIYFSELAALVHADQLDTVKTLDIPVQVKFWLNFINTPNSINWYRAHNSSIIAGYHKHALLAVQEGYAEKVFINMVLYRVLFAQAMVESENIAFGKLGKFLANPRLPAVDFLVHDPFFYPSTYPLTQQESDIILGRVHKIGELEVKVLDNGLIMPHIEELYTKAAEINETPELLYFIADGKPVYPHKSEK